MVNSRKPSRPDPEEAARIYTGEKIGLEKLARRLDCTVYAVLQALKAAGVPRRPKAVYAFTPERFEEVFRTSKGLSCREAALRAGLSPSTMQRHANNRGVAFRKNQAIHPDLHPFVFSLHYDDHLSLCAIGRLMHTTPAIVRGVFKRAGKPTMTAREALIRAHARKTPEQRRQAMEAAMAKRKGMIDLPFHPGRRCRSHGKREMDAKEAVYTALCDEGVKPDLGVVVEGVRLDMAYLLQGVAISVKGRPWSTRRNQMENDCRHSAVLAAAGWRLVCIWVENDRNIDVRAAVDQIRGAVDAPWYEPPS